MGFGSEAVRLARAAVESEVLGTPLEYVPDDGRFLEASGAFVTLSTFPDHDLRGCIGFPMPYFQVGRAIEEAARSACHDPRFPDLRRSELGSVTVEVTILSVPEEIEAETPGDIVSSVVVGRDGLIIDYHGNRGLLLPQVPVEWGWDTEEYLAHLSMKAGLPPDAWTYRGARISSFRGEIFREVSPGGDIAEGERFGHREGSPG